MTFRPASADDVPHVLPMVQKLATLHESWDPAKYGYKPDVAEMYRSWLTARSADPKSVFLVAQREGRLVAFLVGTVEHEIPVYRLIEYGFIHDVWVEEPYRHEGIARQLTMLAIERFADMGVKQVRLDTAFANDVARALFAGCGFHESTREMLLTIQSNPNSEIRIPK
ncbi:MAG: GNAT family N-acetyltransferase [Tepidisphaeraceae bacterium]